MAFRSDESAFVLPALRTDSPIVGMSTDSEPTIGNDGAELEAGDVWVWQDTGAWKYWTGEKWLPVTVGQKDALNTMLLYEIRDLLIDDE